MGRRPEERRAPTWGSPERKTSWPAALLTAAILSSCFLLTQTQTQEIIPVRMEPSQPLKGGNITLTPEGKPNFIICIWYRGEQAEAGRIFTFISTPPEQQNGPKFTQRETAGPGCSLHIRNLTMNDSGNYTVTQIVSGGSEAGRIHIEVLEKVSNVIITSQPNKAIENQLVVLDCSSAGSSVSYFWSKGDQTLESGGRITLGYKNLTISPVTRYDKGNYTCLGRNSFSNFSAIYQLDVFYGPDEPVISPPMQDYVEGSSLTLFCHAESDPPAQYAWSNKTENPETNSQLLIHSLSFDNAGNYICNASNPETGVFNSTIWEIRVWEKLFPPHLWPEEFFVKEHMNIALNCTTSEHSSITVSWFKDGKPVPTKAIPSKQNRTLTIPDISKDDEGLYTCEARNPGNSAMSNAVKVALDSASPPGLSAGQIVGIVIGCLLGVVLIAVVLYFALKSTGVGRMESHSSNGNIPSAPGRNQGVTDTKPAAGEEDIQYTTLAFNSNSPPQAGPGATSPLESGIIYSEIKKK